MSEKLFGRSARITFGKNGEPGRVVTDLRFRFKVTKTSESTPNKAEISVYNMNKEARALAEEQDVVIALDCGYGLNSAGKPKLENLFIGDVARALTARESVTFVTTFECGDGEKAHQSSIVDLSFGPGANTTDVFNILSDKLGLPKGEQTSISRKTFQNGYVAAGPVRRILDQLTADLDLEWSIQDGTLQIVSKGKTTGEEAVVLSAETGLVGAPKKKNNGIEVRCLLQPKIKPGRQVVLRSETIQGVYRVLKVIHTGDTDGQDWYSDMELGEVSNG